MPEFIVTDPTGKEHIVNAPEGATQDQALEFAKSQFGSTDGGAALGNPNLARQGDKAMRSDGGFQPIADIGAAGAAGGVLGAFSKEILTGAGKVVGALPYPAARTVGGFLEGSGKVLGAGGRAAPAIAGAISGASGETAGQFAEVAGAGPVAAEGARIVGGGLTAETAQLSKWIAEKYVTKPALSIGSHIKKLMAKTVLEKMDGGGSLSAKEQKFVNDEIAALRGSAGKTDAPLERVGSIMGDEGKRLMDVADQRLIAAQQEAAGMKPVGAGTEMADVGGSLRDTITKRNEAAITARSGQYKATEKARDALVSGREGAGSYVNSLPEYQKIIDSLKSQLDNTDSMKRSPDVQRSIQKVLGELQSTETTAGEKKLILSGSNLDLQDVPGPPKPTSFQAIDDVRRKLGEVFKGKPAEGYEALNDARGRELYASLIALQKKFAGGETGPHAKLLEDYHSQSEALGQFRTKLGKKATALDQYQEGAFATDASVLPAAYFKTRASVQALKELTGNQAQVNNAALEFANKELSGKDAAGVRKWLGNNTEWLAETGPTRVLIDRYATKLEGVERSMRNAQDFAAQAANDSSMLTRNSLPAQRAVDLIKSGDTELWGKIAPAIAQSPQAKVQMVSAVRQVIADQATAKATSDLFARNIRPFLEKSSIASKAEMDFIAQRLDNIQKMSLPEAEKLGMARRLLLQGAGGWAATAAARSGVSGYEWSREKMVPQ